ncbi:TetR/AcrR family transcriptional regulator [Actinoplanes sp. TFC3]|uniref:TetR/AcrR family transcriptional regulator n=1 Tax=Actinoplanes sp. TFC3 TaxID=1710355 RepID=UPI000B25FE4B|nr:TetR/AcrR family transcriptional regulator [Actinoplanes sp. TFC3]
MTAALRIMREEGLERLTMRRLAAELDTGPASLYVYVQNMAELHAALLDELLADIALPHTGPVARWRDGLIDIMTAYTVLLFQHPSLARSVLTLRPSGPNYLRLIDTLLGLLNAGGVPQRQAAWGVNLLLQHGTATAAEQGTRGESVEADGEQLALMWLVEEASSEDYPNIDRARSEIFSGTGPERLSWALGVLIDGIVTTSAL